MSAITSHYVDEHFVLHEDLLDFQHVPGPHTGLNLAKHLRSVIHDFQFQSKLFCITTDNASNNYKMMQELSRLLLVDDAIVWDGSRNHIPCLAHVLNLSVKAFLAHLKVQPPTEEQQWMDSNDSDDDVDSMGDDNNDANTSRTFRPTAGNEFKSTIQKVRSTSVTISFPPSRRQNFEAYCDAVSIKKLRAVKDHDIRWNATFNMIQRAVYLKPAINAWAHSKPEFEHLVLTAREWELAEFLLLFLAPFKKATDYIQSTSRPSLHQTFMTYEHLFNCLDDAREAIKGMPSRPGWASLIEGAIEAMWNKLRKYYSQTDKPTAFVDSTILHPAKKLAFFKKQSWDAALIERYKEESRARFEDNYNQASSMSPPPKRQNTGNDSDSDSEEEELSNEFDHYIKSKRDRHVTDPLNWWSKSQSIFPRMSKMARDVYAVPATGCGVEREFSISGKVVSKERNRLDVKTISDLMQYKRWVAHNGVILDELVGDVVGEESSDDETGGGWDYDDDEGNEVLVNWLKEWEAKNTLANRLREWAR